MATQKTLYILRHAKAESGSSGQEDHERALIDRGVRAARAIGKYMVAQGMKPGRVICSTAVRARQTLEEVQKVYVPPLPVEYQKKLYMASGGETLNLLAEVPESVTSLLVVGHNPGFHQLALKLAGDGDEALLNTLMLKFPTCALATITFDAPWRNLPRTRGTLTGFVTPKLLAGEEDD